MRLFVAIELPREIRDILEKIGKSLPKEAAKMSCVLSPNMHVTLKFLGEVEEKKVEEIKAALRDITIAPFSLSTTKISVFPSASKIRVVWVGFKEEAAILSLQQRIDDALHPLGFAKEKDYIPHLTICRVKYVKDKEKLVQAIRKTRVEERTFPVRSFVVMQSTLTKAGPVHAVVEEYQ